LGDVAAFERGHLQVGKCPHGTEQQRRSRDPDAGGDGNEAAAEACRTEPITNQESDLDGAGQRNEGQQQHDETAAQQETGRAKEPQDRLVGRYVERLMKRRPRPEARHRDPGMRNGGYSHSIVAGGFELMS